MCSYLNNKVYENEFSQTCYFNLNVCLMLTPIGMSLIAESLKIFQRISVTFNFMLPCYGFRSSTSP